MKNNTRILITGTPALAGGNLLTELTLQLPLAGVHLPAPSLPRLAILKAQLSCAALTFAALVIAAAYIFIPLALAVHSAVHPVLLALVIAAAVLIESALIVTMIILKTEAPSE